MVPVYWRCCSSKTPTMLAARSRSASAILHAAARRRRPLPPFAISVSNLGATAYEYGWRSRISSLDPKLSNRLVHATPWILSDDNKSNLSKLNNYKNIGRGYNKTSGSARPKSKNNVSVSQTDAAAAYDDETNHDNDAPYYEYAPDEFNLHGEEGGDRLKLWHDAKDVDFEQLDIVTTKFLTSNDHKANDIISQIQSWNEFISSITTDMDFEFRTKNPYYPPSDFMTSITYEAAERATTLLMHLITQQREKGMKISPALEVSAYKLVMNAWSLVYHWSSGDRCEEVLEVYGQKFGGDMNYMPSIEDYKTVMKAHLKSCSSRYSNVYDDSSNDTGPSPGEKALEILNLLNNVYTAGDLFLKPDVELYSHTIAVVKNTLLDWQSRRRFRENDLLLEKQLALELLSVLEQMELTIAEDATLVEGKDEKVHTSLERWRCIIRAYADAIAVVSRVPVGSNVTNSMRSSDQILETLEQFISSNSAEILNCAKEDTFTRDAIFDDIQRSIENAYISNLSSQLTVSDFNTALKNAVASERIFDRMKERSVNAAIEEAKLFPGPTPEHVQSIIRANVECLRRKYVSPESNSEMNTLDELPHLKAQRLLTELETKQDGSSIEGSFYSDVAWVYTQIPYWSSIYKRDKYASVTKSLKALLEHTNEQYSQGLIQFSSIGTSTKIYNYLFGLYSQAAKNSRSTQVKEDSLKQCLGLLDAMEFQHRESGGTIAKPDSQTLGLILKTISHSGLPSRFKNANDILERLAKYGVKAKQRDYLILMKTSKDPTKVEEILNRIRANYDKDQSEKPTTALYTECISAYARSRNQSNEKVMQLFDELNELYESTGDPDFRPDSTLYGATLNAISKSKSAGNVGIRQALQLLDKMESKFDSGKIDVGPNRYAYTTIFTSISQSRVPDGHLLAEDLLRKMRNRARLVNDEEILPDTVAYTALLQTLARSKSRDKINRATKWFAEMETLYVEGNPNLKPNKITYNALINCWRTSGHRDSGEQAQKILELVEQRNQEGDYEIKPDAMLYSSVIDAWSRGQSAEKVEKAWALYSNMREQYSNGNVDMQPNDIIVSTFICN